MAGGIVINGRFTARPGLYSNIEYITIPSAPTQGSVLAVVGEFPFLEKGVPYLSTSQKSLEDLAPSSMLLKKLSSIIYNPFRDAANSAAPAQVYLMSPVGNEQAKVSFGSPGGTITVKAKQWGTTGNKTSFRIKNNALGGYDVVVANNGVQENIRVPDEPAAMNLRYAYPGTALSTYPVKGFGTWGDGPTGSEGSVSVSVGDSYAGLDTGDVRVSFSRILKAAAAGVTGSDESWIPDGPVYGQLSIRGINTPTLTNGKMTVKVTGISNSTGGTVTDEVVFNNSAELLTAKLTPTSFASVSLVRLTLETTTPATTFSGRIQIEGNNFPIFNAAGGQTYIAEMIRAIQPYSAYGFYATTVSSRVSSIKLTELDAISAAVNTSGGYNLTLYGAKIVNTVNAASRLVTLERGDVAAPVVPAGAGYFSFLAGGTEANPVLATDWSDALSELVWYNIDVLCAFYDPTGTTPAEDVILPEFIAHLGTMWSDGANERTLWTGAGNGETLNELVQRSALFNSERVMVVADSAYIQQPDGSTELMRPYWHALMHAAADASQLTVDSLTRARLRVLGTSRDASLSSKEAMNDLIQAGLIIAFTPPGGVPRIEREVTTWTQDTNPARTEAICTRSVRDSTKAMRAALEDLLNPGGGVRVLADVKATVITELARQTESLAPLISGYDRSSVTISELADRYEIGYVITVRINKNFITLNVGVTVPVGTI
jgi:hypothetical protein